MSLFQAFLCGLLYYLCNGSITIISYVTWYRPLVGGFLTGCILGDPVQGTIIGATINMMFIGFISAGGALPSDMALAGVLGTALAISGGLDVNSALAIAVPLGLLGTLVWVGRMTLDSIFNRWTNKIIAKGQFKGLWWPTIIAPQIFLFCITAIPCFLACYFGSQVVGDVINSLGATFLGVLSTVGGIMPALGIAITMKYIFKGDTRVFLFLGFFLSAWAKFSLIAIGCFAVCIAIMYTQLSSKIEGAEDEEA